MTGQSLQKLKTFSKWINLEKTPCVSGTNIDVNPASGKVHKKDQHEKSPKEFVNNSVREGNSAVSSKFENFKTFSKWIRLSERNIGISCGKCDKNIALCENIKKNEQNERVDNGGNEKATKHGSSPNKFNTFSRWIRISPQHKQCRKQNKSSLIRSINKQSLVENDSTVRAVFSTNEDEKMDSSSFKKFEKLKTFSTPKCSDVLSPESDQNSRMAWNKDETDATNSENALFSNSVNVENPSFSEKRKTFSRWITLQETYEKSHKEKSVSNGLQVFYGKRYLEKRDTNFLSSELNLDQTEPILSIDLDSSFDETIFEKPKGSSTPKKKYQSKTFAMESNEENPLSHHKSEIENRLNRNLFPTLNTTETHCLDYKTKKTSEGMLDKKIFEESIQTILDEDTGELFYQLDYFLLSSSPRAIKFGKNAKKPDWLIKCEQKLDEKKQNRD